jgi:hypothetical protein
MFEEAPTVSSIAQLPWNVVDTIVAYVDSVATLGRIACLHSCFCTALEHDPLWETMCKARYPSIHTRLANSHVDSWQFVLRRECTTMRMQSVGKLVAEGAVDQASQETVQRCLDLSFQSCRLPILSR